MRRFTPDEANEALTRVRPLTEQLVAARRRFLTAQQELGAIKLAVAGNGGHVDTRRAATLEARSARAARDVGEAASALEELGVQIKDVDTGLLDFPAKHPEDGSDVLLCWRLDEPSVGYWHGVEDGFAGRKPLPF